MMTYQVSAFALAIVFVANISYIANADQVFNYDVTVHTSGSTKFSAHDGKLKLTVVKSSGKTQEDFVLTPNDVNLTMNSKYTGQIASSVELEDIKSVYLQWTLATPYNPYFAIKKPSIYFDLIVFGYKYKAMAYRTHINMQKVQNFCPSTQPIGIEHADGASFNACGSIIRQVLPF
ncbi:uncharacterized protein LOC107370417 [Tetranychus urticae]|uniref:Reelin domain-containing protein n=1 Tax=Tetranychus urticae TaxID=32264 RepID=T1L5F1_TETUR|nr:uncharacterized protein LOC107370417 [Tetranychus urticae]